MRTIVTRYAPELYGAGAGALAGALLALAALAELTAWEAVVPAAVVVGVVVATGLRGRRAEQAAGARRRIQARNDRAHLNSRLSKLDARLASLETGAQDVVAAAALSAVELPFPLPLGGFALDPQVAGALAREVAIGRPRVVVELGSGTSSAIIGHQLARNGEGHLYALEHETRYAERTRATLRALGLDSVVTVLDAPLVDTVVDGATFRWYRMPEEVASLSQVDLLLVDGPPQATDPDGMPRFPAFPVLAPKLVAGSVVFVDDMIRDAEQRMVARWTAGRPDIEVESVRSRHGLAILRLTAGA